MAISTTAGRALIDGASRQTDSGATMQIKLNMGKVTSKGPCRAGDIVDLPEAEAKDFIRHKWATVATADASAPVVDVPKVENREDDVAASTSKRGRGRPRKVAE